MSKPSASLKSYRAEVQKREIDLMVLIGNGLKEIEETYPASKAKVNALSSLITSIVIDWD